MSLNLTLKASLFVLVLFTNLSMLAIGDGDFNKMDPMGQRQGHWIIKGYMVNDKAYPADATVEEGDYKDNRKEGLWKKYWPDGKLKSEIVYVLGQTGGRIQSVLQQRTVGRARCMEQWKKHWRI